MALTLLCIRHAPTATAGLCVGRHDVPATLCPAEAAEAMAAKLEGAPIVDVVWSSPLARCRKPAARLAARWGVPLRIDSRVIELSFGQWESRTWEALAIEDGVRLDTWLNQWQTVSPPGGEDLATLSERVASWRAELKDGVHLLVAHAGVVRALRVMAGCTWADAMAEPVPHLSLVRPFE